MCKRLEGQGYGKNKNKNIKGGAQEECGIKVNTQRRIHGNAQESKEEMEKKVCCYNFQGPKTYLATILLIFS